ncbi:PucR family transcriptional regulator [Anaerocolumna sp. MB42-C2]|uniref:PucR family transcriptional regulator n=1 Tax=Anaerocolumna sp. MB42-C2 TaxID=3070997 RepID=UPI0027E1B2DC|nr:PucR family transcriptional regulator ligand-binding domain-containing protein [Anaerocolumna sp. MB42-C2]WMJ86984.1 PucR family transcriptional regulator ligand-binding domain-containing protein [Anaerocolumna sp. MB42-C2]
MASKTTINWLIDKNSKDGMYYLAGNTGGDNPIVGINIMDNPDTVPWLKKNELILSTGYLFTSTDLYRHIIYDLHERNCAGLGIKLNRYLDELPSEMLEQSNELGFPIFCIPFGSTMEEIANQVYHNIFLEEMSETQKAADLYKSITEAALKKHSLPPLLKNLSGSFQAAAFLTNHDFEIIEYSIPIQSKDTFPYPFSQNTNTLFPSNVILNLKTLQAEKPVPVHKYKLSKNNKEYFFLIFPITSGKTLSGFLIFLQEKQEFTAFDYDLIRNIIPIIHVSLISNSLFTENVRSSRYLFYDNLLSGKLKNESEIEPACIQNGFHYKKYRVCVTFRIENYAELTIAKRRALERKVFNQLDSYLDEKSIDHTSAVYDIDFILFIFFSNYKSQSETSRTACETVKALCTELNKAGIICKAGISGCYHDALTIQKCYTQAISALELGQKLHAKDMIYTYNDDYIYHLFTSNLTNEKMLEIYSETLSPITGNLKDPENENLKTLLSYLDNGLNISQAAKALFIHRNTMFYRVEQLEKLLGMDLKDTGNVFRLRLALYIKELLEL